MVYYESKAKAIYSLLMSGALLAFIVYLALNTENGFDLGWGWVLFLCCVAGIIFGVTSLLDSNAQLILDDDGVGYNATRWSWPEIEDMTLKIRSLGFSYKQGMGDAVRIVLTLQEKEKQTLYVSSLNASGREIFKEAETLWNKNRHRPDLIAALDKRSRSQPDDVQSQNTRSEMPALRPGDSDADGVVLFGAEQIQRGISYFPDWSAAMHREFDDLDDGLLQKIFPLAENLSECPEDQWQGLLDQWRAG